MNHPVLPPVDLYDLMHQSAEFLHARGIEDVDVGVVLGSGLTAVQDLLEETVSIPYCEIPHMPVSGAPGHEGVLRYGKIANRKVLMFCGRLHFYEGLPMWRITYPMRILQALQVKSSILTAAAGGLQEDLKVGDLVLIRDHISLMTDNPLRGIIDSKLGERFPDLTTAYNPSLAEELKIAASLQGIELKPGVYVGLPGPSLETQAECNFLRLVGGDVVGMSVIPEVIVGVQAGIRMAAMSIVSNLAWHPGDLAPSKVDEILETAAVASVRISSVLQCWCSAL